MSYKSLSMPMGYEPTFFLVSAAAYALLAYLVFRAGRTIASVLFSIVPLSAALWVLGGALFIMGGSPHVLRAALFIQYIALITAPVAFYAFTRIFIKNAPPADRFIYGFPIILGIVLLLLYVIFQIPDSSAPGMEGSPHLVFHLALFLYLVCYGALGYHELFRADASFASASSREHLQMREVVMGLTLPLFAGMGIGIGVIAFRLDALAWVGPFTSLLCVGTVPLAIDRYRLLRLDMVATEALVIFLWFLLFTRMITAQDAILKAIDGVLLAIASILGVLLVRSITHEASTRVQLDGAIRDLSAANRRLQSFDQQKSEFVSIASHQLRTPVTAIRGYVSMTLEQSFGELNVAIREPLERIRISSERLARTVEDLLAASRLERGAMEFSFMPVDIEVLLERIGGAFRRRFLERGVQFSIQREGDEQFTVRADEEKIASVLRSILEHAYATTDRGRVEVLLTQDRATGRVRIVISDTGAGVDQATMESFFRVDTEGRTTKRSKKNRWLWLYLADRIIAAHQGSLWVQSEGLGSGATFFIELPLHANGTDHQYE